MAGINEEELNLFGIKLNILGNAYDSPIKSSELCTYMVAETENKVQLSLKDIDAKAIFFSIYELEGDEKRKYVIPMMH